MSIEKIIQKIFKRHRAKKIFKRANMMLNKSGGNYASFFGIDVPYFDGFEKIDIEKYHAEGSIPRKRIVIKTDDIMVFFAEKTAVSFELIKYDPGSWEMILTDKDFN